MARSGRFGRLPRNAPDLTGTIVALLREYQAQRERNVVDAWKNGGTFEGKKVTDQMVLDFYEDKMSGMAKDDPLYEEAKNTHQQYEFAIANSKMELKYAQGKVGAGAMVGFYKRWAGKLPRNSEAWRNLMSLAAQYKDRATSAAAGRRAAASSRAYNQRQQNIYNNREAKYDILNNAVLDLALREGVLNKKGETWKDLRSGEMDQTGILTVFAKLNSDDPAYQPWRDWAEREAQKVGQSFKGDFSYERWVGLSGDKRAGLTAGISVALAAGRKGDASKRRAERGKLATDIMTMAAVPALDSYTQFRSDLNDVLNDGMATPADTWQAVQDYAGQLGALHDDLTRTAAQVERAGLTSVGEQDPLDTYIGRLKRELTVIHTGKSDGGPTLSDGTRLTEAEARSGTKLGQTPDRDADRLLESVKFVAETIGNLSAVDENGQPTHVQMVVDGAWEAVPISQAKGQLSVSVVQNEDDIVLPNGERIDTGKFVTAAKGTPVRGGAMKGTGAVNPFGGDIEMADTKGGNPYIGAVFDMPDGQRIYSFTDDAGDQKFTYVNPFSFAGEGLGLQRDGDDFIVTMPGGTRAKFDPRSLIDPSLRNPELAAQQPNTVFDSGYASWLMSPAGKSKGAAYRQDTSDMLRALQVDMGDDPRRMAKAVQELDEIRTASVVDDAGETLRRGRAAKFGGALPLVDEDWAAAAGGPLREEQIGEKVGAAFEASGFSKWRLLQGGTGVEDFVRSNKAFIAGQSQTAVLDKAARARELAVNVRENLTSVSPLSQFSNFFNARDVAQRRLARPQPAGAPPPQRGVTIPSWARPEPPRPTGPARVVGPGKKPEPKPPPSFKPKTVAKPVGLGYASDRTKPYQYGGERL